MLVESYSRTRWLDKLRPAGTSHRWMGWGPDGTCRGHWLIPLLKKKKLDYISRFVHVILAPVHAILLCIDQARNSSNYVRHPYADTVGESSRNWQELRPMYRRDSSPEYSTRIPYVSSMPPYITAHHILQFTRSCHRKLLCTRAV